MTKSIINTLILLFALSSITGCNDNRHITRLLAEADSLLTHEKTDSAITILKKISSQSIDDETKAYCCMLTTKAAAMTKRPADTTEADFAINHYTKTGNYEMLTKTLNNKSLILERNGQKERALEVLKKAEKAALKHGDPSITSKIYLNLAYTNFDSGNITTALAYAKKAVTAAEKAGDKNIMCRSLNIMAICFSYNDMNDSVKSVLQKAEKHIKHLSKTDKAVICTNIGISYLNSGDLQRGERFIIRSLNAEPTTEGYYASGILHIKKNNKDTAYNMLEKALLTAGLQMKTEILRHLIDLDNEAGRYKEAARLGDSLIAVTDSLKRRQQTEVMLSLQNKIDTETKEHENRRRRNTALATGIALLAAIAAVATYYIRKWKKAGSEIQTNRRLIAQYEKKVAALSNANRRHGNEISVLNKAEEKNQKEIERLKKKIDEVRCRQNDILGNGCKLFESIAGGGTTARWEKADFEAFIEYCRIKSPQAVADIEASHKKLTPYNMMFLLLPLTGLPEEKQPAAMNMSPGAARTMKWRLKEK